MGYEGACRSFPISFADPPVSPGGIGASEPDTPSGVSSQSRIEHETIRRPGSSYAQYQSKSHNDAGRIFRNQDRSDAGRATA